MRMTGAGNSLAVDVGRRRLAAVWAAPTSRGVRVVKSVERVMPEGLNSEDAAAVGAWVRRVWEEEKLPQQAVTLVLDRALVGIKRLTLPTTVAEELPDMIRLSLQREAVAGMSGAIDFLVVGKDEKSTTVIAFSAPDKEIASTRRVVESAGLRVRRITLRGIGATAMAASIEPQAGVVVVDLTGEALEVSVVANGVLQYSRGVELAAGDDAATAQAAMTEIRRSWLSFRMGQEGLAIEQAIVMGPRALTASIAAGVAEVAGVKARVLEEHGEVESRGGLGSAWTLAGLLLALRRKREIIDFSRPRKAPDLAARYRQRLMLAGGGAAVLLLGAWTMGQKSLRELREKVDTQKEQWSEMAPRSDRYLRDEFRLEHLRHWTDVNVNWLDHAQYLMSISPGTRLMVLNQWSGSLNAPPFKYTEKDGWTASPEFQIQVEGEAKDRLLADQFRTAIIGDKRYSLETTGADKKGGRRYPYPFGYLLKASLEVKKPETDSKKPQATKSDDSKGGEPS